jgi:peptidoglycan-associated lipoprotein
MGKKINNGLIALAFVCCSLLLVASCAKKPAEVSEAIQPTTQKVEAEEARQGEMAGTALSSAQEAERQARLQELERSQKIAELVRMFESENIYFDFDRSDLKSESKAILVKKANWLRQNPAYSLRIEGNCDERGSNEYNLALGERRAHAAKKYLMALGISGDRISTISYGEERPVDPGHNEEAWDKNRRDEFHLIK